jgi:hypothetical protein
MHNGYDQLPENFHIRAHIPHYTDCVTEQEFQTIWQTLCVEGKKDIVFYDGQITNESEFVQFMQDDTNYVYVAYEGVKPLALVWVNNFLGRCGMIHFTMFYNSRGKEELISSFLLNFLLFTKHQGEYCFDALYGLTPKVYRHALRFIEKLGFRLVAEMPASVFFQKKDQNCLKSAVFSIIHRDECNCLK